MSTTLVEDESVWNFLGAIRLRTWLLSLALKRERERERERGGGGWEREREPQHFHGKHACMNKQIMMYNHVQYHCQYILTHAHARPHPRIQNLHTMSPLNFICHKRLLNWLHACFQTIWLVFISVTNFFSSNISTKSINSSKFALRNHLKLICSFLWLLVSFFFLTIHPFCLKGEVRTINDRNIWRRRSCMKNNDKSPTFKFISGEERRPSEVQRVSRGWRLPGATHSSADLTWIRKWLQNQAPELSELESVELQLGSCCSDLEKRVSDEICRTRNRQFEIPFRL